MFFGRRQSIINQGGKIGQHREMAEWGWSFVDTNKYKFSFKKNKN